MLVVVVVKDCARVYSPWVTAMLIWRISVGVIPANSGAGGAIQQRRPLMLVGRGVDCWLVEVSVLDVIVDVRELKNKIAI